MGGQIGGTAGELLGAGQRVLGQTGLGRVVSAGGPLSGVANPNIKTNEAQARADQLRDAILARRGTLEGREGIYHSLPQFQGFEAAEVGDVPPVDISEALRGEALGLSRQLATQPQTSAAMDQHRLATDRGMSQALALAATQRNPAALRQALEAQGQIQSRAGLQSSLIRSREEQNQASNLARAAQLQAGLRGQDIGASTTQARLSLEQALANQRALQQSRQFGADAFNRRAQAEQAARIQQDRDREAAIGRTFDQQTGATRTSADIAKVQSRQQGERTGRIMDVAGNVLAGLGMGKKPPVPAPGAG